ncbi:MAG: nucleotidyltransferase family protein [Syntrophaceae bacterium]|nr:nucleotidyltransferase family protein [Syntrophaceae bacterium]
MTFLPEGFDWNRFLRLCEWHNVAPLVCRVLPTVVNGAVSPAAVDRLRGLSHGNTARSLFLVTELSRILGALEASGVPAYPFKGPALSVLLHGDPARRQSKDLDILVPREKLRWAIKALDALGYRAQGAREGVRLAAHRQAEYETALLRRDGRLQVELQWAVVPAYFGFDHERLGIWSRLEARAWNGSAFPVLPPEESLLLLCVHGAKHLWCKLGWVCDVAGLLASPAPPDFRRALELAERCGVKRLLLLGLLLAGRLAGARLPREVSDRIEADLMVLALARQALAVIASTPVNPDADPARYLFYLKAKDCRRDQLLFAGRLLATLAAGEWNPAALPDMLAPLYYLARPIHMAARHGTPVLRALARR